MTKTKGVRISVTVVLVLMLITVMGVLLYALGSLDFRRFSSGPPSFKGKIALVPLANIEEGEVTLAKSQIERFYGFEVTVLERQKMPKSSFHQPRQRYKAKLVLNYLKDIKPKDYDKVIALTDKDISTMVRGHEDWGVIGLAYLGKEPCIVSTYRLGKRKVSKSKYEQRLTKASLHEVGHTLGLPHCATSSCFMVDAGGRVATIDKAEVTLCSSCKKSLTFLAYKRATLFSATAFTL
ncbi:zinc-dependent metalloprotease [Pontibacter sp. BAB1700]|uniref:zinc-dependent metalloprotease n=1 Tax=Pontibacter sp. BAB1700 TaxID=1144253 RepID=UPI00026BE94A|nr:zinc-dependent metalloprotease [Pontibacter sp. BAB1700]EJF09324.1 M54 archaelysin family metalloprotease precursor [Pontibacter sp. BAB1700]